MSRRKIKDDNEPLPKLTKENWRQAFKIFDFVQPYKWTLVIGMFLLFLSSMVFMLFLTLPGEMVDIAQGKGKYDLDLKDIGLILLVVLFAQGFISYARVLLFARVSEKGIADVRMALYEKLVSLPIVFYEKNRVGELISRLTADVEKLYNAFSITLAEFTRQIIILIAGIVFLAISAPKLALIMIATFPVIVIFAMFFGRYIRKLSKERQDRLADSNVILSETSQTISAVKSFTNEWFEYRRYGTAMEATVKVALKYAQARALFTVFIVSILFGVLFFIIWQGAVMVQNGTMTAGNLISFVVYTATIGGAIAGLGNFYTDLLGAIGATERVRQILDEVGEVDIKASKGDLGKKILGRIDYENVHFRYPTRIDVPVLKGLSFQVEAGQKIALVGSSGAGKSTIVQLLLKFYNIESGGIKVDGKSIYEYNTTAYRQNIAIVPQEVILFGGSIRENILYGKPNASDQEIIEAAKQANAWEFISSFPEGLETMVGERGIKLSGGQRQRVAIARAILKNPAILLLDEATSSLDAESEKLVQEALNNLMKGRTSIIIAHRLATIREVDCIYVMDNGQIIEKGTHEELAIKENGAYNNLAKLQFDNA
ncbi:MAG: ABC transporter transmembrane domain-containing protein [Saprospiraceae bacterium]|jgi:ABC-type multidrug transport system fused ATPase/permease subunit|nr:ABC transporter transmembrane domain-containing protein [Saprospiraceae bacterium]